MHRTRENHSHSSAGKHPYRMDTLLRPRRLKLRQFHTASPASCVLNLAILQPSPEVYTGRISDGGTMKRAVSVVFLSLVLFTQLLVAQTQPPSPSQSGSNASQQANANCTSNGTYVNSKGQTVKRPENCSSAPQGATAQCRDGSYSFSRSRSGTCSHHGGVAKWL